LAYLRAKVVYNYGFSHKEVSEMPWNVFREYAASLKGLKAEDEMILIQASSFPKMKKPARDKILSTLKRTLKNAVENDFTGRLATAGDVAKSIARMMGRG
jgi:hypothetical protein